MVQATEKLICPLSDVNKFSDSLSHMPIPLYLVAIVAAAFFAKVFSSNKMAINYKK